MSDTQRNQPELSRWQAPEVGASARCTQPDANELAQLREAARAEGFAHGEREGLAAAQAQACKLQTQLNAMLDALCDPLAAVDEKVIEELTRLSTRIAGRLVRRELRTNRSEIIAVVREALGVLPLGLRDVRLHLHPEDARLVSETLVPAEGQAAWQIVEDPVITRGGCRISSASSQIDATVETRLARVINTVLGGERDEDRDA